MYAACHRRGDPDRPGGPGLITRAPTGKRQGGPTQRRRRNDRDREAGDVSEMEEEPRAKECGSLEKRQDADRPPGPQREGRPADTTREPHEAHLGLLTSKATMRITSCCFRLLLTHYSRKGRLTERAACHTGVKLAQPQCPSASFIGLESPG